MAPVFRTPTVAALFVCAAVMSNAPLYAGPVTVTFNNVSPGYSPAGQYNWTLGGPNIPGIVYTSGNNFATFCIEQTQYIWLGQTYSGYQFTTLTNAANPGPTITPQEASNLQQMWAEFRHTIGNDNDKAAAFQHAVWHLVDSSYNPSLSGNVLTYYNQYINPANWNSGYANLIAMVHPRHQDQILELRRGYRVNQFGDIEPVPAPATLAVGLLMVGGWLVRRRMLRTATA